MVLFSRQRFGARRFGQAQNPAGLPAAVTTASGQTFEVAVPQGATQQEINAVANVAQNISQSTLLPGNTTLDQLQGVGVNADFLQNQNTGEVTAIVNNMLPEGQQSQMIAEVPVPTAQAVPAEVCEFPAQSVNFTRQVNIANTPPQITNIVTDVCGNAVSFEESMTRTLTAGPWVAANPTQLQQGINGVATFTQQGNEYVGPGGVVLANNLQFNPAGAQYGRQGGSRNRNAGMMAASMLKWRGA